MGGKIACDNFIKICRQIAEENDVILLEPKCNGVIGCDGECIKTQAMFRFLTNELDRKHIKYDEDIFVAKDEKTLQTDEESEEDNYYDYDDEYDIESTCIDLDDFYASDDIGKMILLEDEGLWLDDYADYFDNYDSLYMVPDEIIDLRRAGGHEDELFGMTDQEKADYLKQIDLDYRDYLDFFEYKDFLPSTNEYLSFSEYDYKNAFSYCSYEKSLVDNIEGNSEIIKIAEREKEFQYQLYNQDYYIYKNLKNWYPGIENIIESILAIKEKKSERKVLIERLKTGDNTIRERLAELYAPQILRKSFEESVAREEDFIEVWDRNLEFLMDGIDICTKDYRFESPLHYVNYKRKFFRMAPERSVESDIFADVPHKIKGMIYNFNMYDEIKQNEIVNHLESGMRCHEVKRGEWPFEETVIEWTCDSDISYINMLGACARRCNIKEFLFYIKQSFVDYDNLILENEEKMADVPEELMEYNTEDLCEIDFARIELRNVLETLTEREQNILILRFGLKDGRARTLEETGRVYNLTRERVRQIEAKALRKLRHPSRSRRLKGYFGIGE